MSERSSHALGEPSRPAPGAGLPPAELAAALGLEFVADVSAGPPAALRDLLPGRTARSLGVVPWRERGRELAVLCLDPLNGEAARDLAFALDRPVRLLVADRAAVQALLDRHHPAAAETGAPQGPESSDGASEAARLLAQASEGPVVRFVADTLERAIAAGASDIHFEPLAGRLRIRCRIDGALREFAEGPGEVAAAAVSRVKVLAALDVAERRRPQDGRIRHASGERAVDLRVATLPTQEGESAVLRVLDPANAQRGLDALALPAAVRAGLDRVLRRPDGILVVTGPTGSGKTTTLYGCLRQLNSGDVKILTAEDPVEYEIEGVTQVAVQPAIGLTFAESLRSFLRQDPDVVMVGEIRDLETAQIATQAALTGHLVLTTLHTTDAPGAVARLLDFGVEPYRVAATLEAVLAQRLVRRICETCRGRTLPTEEQSAQLGAADGREFFAGRGCADCAGTGYRGRLGLFEWLRIDETLRAAIVRGAPVHELRAGATAGGWRPLRAAGLDAAAAGLTTLDEVLRVT